MCGVIAVVVVACGRASEEDINNALNITPTPTLSTQQIADQTAAAQSEASTREAAQAALSSPGAEGSAVVDLASAGNPTLGRTAFLMRCQGCHTPGGQPAPALSGPGNPATKYTDEQLVQLLRTGEGHATPPGPLSVVDVNEKQMIDILAFIRQQSK